MLKMSLFSCFCLVFVRATMADIFVFPYLLFDILFKLQNALIEVEDKRVIFCFHMHTFDFHLIYGGKPGTFFVPATFHCRMILISSARNS